MLYVYAKNQYLQCWGEALVPVFIRVFLGKPLSDTIFMAEKHDSEIEERWGAPLLYLHFYQI